MTSKLFTLANKLNGIESAIRMCKKKREKKRQANEFMPTTWHTTRRCKYLAFNIKIRFMAKS